MSDNAKTPEDMAAEANQRTIQDVFRLWINPEVERRQAAGLLKKPYLLEKAQVVMNVDRPIEVRLNDEVRAVMHVEVDPEVQRAMKPGQPITWDAIKEITDLQLTDQDANAAHITLLAVPRRGIAMFFDFHYNGARVVETVEAAEQFLAAAGFAVSQGHGRAFAENLFAATELTAKAMLLSLPFPEVLKSKKHKTIAAKLNQWGRSPQNVDRAFVRLHNELGSMRDDARYVAGSVAWTVEEMNAKTAVVRGTLDRVKAQAPKRAPRRR